MANLIAKSKDAAKAGAAAIKAATAAANKAEAAVTASRATRTAQEIAAEQIRTAANMTDQQLAEQNEAHHAGQKRMDDRLEAEYQEYTLINSLGTECGEALAGDKELDKFARQNIAWNEEESVKAITYKDFIEAHLSKEQIARLPWPKSEKTDVAGTNLLFDKTKIEKDGKWIAWSFYRSMVAAHPIGRQHMDILEKEAEAVANKEKSRTPYAGKARGAVNAMLRGFEQAGKLLIQIDRIKNVPNISWKYVQDDHGKIVKTRQCIYVWENEKPDRNIYVTVAGFCAWRVTKEVIKKGTIESLKKSVKAKAKPTAVKEDKYKQTSLLEMTQAWNAGLTWYQNVPPSEMTRRHTEMLEALTKNDDLRWSAYRLLKMLRPIFESNDNALEKLAVAYEKKAQQAAQQTPAPGETQAA